MASFIWKKLLSIVRLVFPSKVNAKRLSTTPDTNGIVQAKKFRPGQTDPAAPRNGNY